MGGRHARDDGPLGPFTHAVEPSREAPAAPPGAARIVEEKLARDAPRAQMCGEVEVGSVAGTGRGAGWRGGVGAATGAAGWRGA